MRTTRVSRRALPLIAGSIAVVAASLAAQGPETAASLLVRQAQSSARARRADGLDVVQLRPNFYVIAGAGANIGVRTGPDGLVVVDSGRVERAAAVVATAGPTS